MRELRIYLQKKYHKIFAGLIFILSVPGFVFGAEGHNLSMILHNSSGFYGPADIIYFAVGISFILTMIAALFSFLRIKITKKHNSKIIY